MNKELEEWQEFEKKLDNELLEAEIYAEEVIKQERD